MDFGAGEWILAAIITTLIIVAVVHRIHKWWGWDKTLIEEWKPHRRKGLLTRRDLLFFLTGFGFGFWTWLAVAMRSMP